MPYPNEHSCRKTDPKQYDTFRRNNNRFGSGIHAVFGIKLKPKRVSELQSIRFDKNKFTVAKAKKWLKDHDHTCHPFEAAGKMEALSISGVIGWDVKPEDVRGFLDGAEGNDIEVQISSPGGYVYPGLEIFNLLRNYSGHVTTRLMGLAASMASYIAMVGDYVIAEDNAIFMIHNTAGLALGDHRTMRKVANIIEGLSNLLAKKYMEKSDKTLAEIKELMDDETFLFGDEIVEAGFVDEIAKTEKEKNRDTAVAFATAAITECAVMMKSAGGEFEDLEKAAAFLNTIKPIMAKDGGDYGAKYVKYDFHSKPKGGKSMKTMKEILAIEDVEERNKEIDAFFGELFDEDREDMVKGVLKSIGTKKKEEPVTKEVAKANEELVKTVMDLQGQVESLKVEVKDATEATKVATEATKVERDARRLLEIKESLKDSEVSGDIKEMADMIFALEEVDPELAEKMVSQFKATSEKLKAAGIFTEIGSGTEGKGDGSSYEKLKKLVDEAVEADPTISPAKAWKDVIRDNPELYKEHLNEKRGR